MIEQLVFGLSPQRSRINPRQEHAGFMVGVGSLE